MLHFGTDLAALVARVGASAAKRILLTGSTFGATEALRIGLVVELHEPDRLEEAALAKAELIMANTPFATSSSRMTMPQTMSCVASTAAASMTTSEKMQFRTAFCTSFGCGSSTARRQR